MFAAMAEERGNGSLYCCRARYRGHVSLLFKNNDPDAAIAQSGLNDCLGKKLVPATPDNERTSMERYRVGPRRFASEHSVEISNNNLWLAEPLQHAISANAHSQTHQPVKQGISEHGGEFFQQASHIPGLNQFDLASQDTLSLGRKTTGACYQDKSVDFFRRTRREVRGDNAAIGDAHHIRSPAEVSIDNFRSIIRQPLDRYGSGVRIVADENDTPVVR